MRPVLSGVSLFLALSFTAPAQELAITRFHKVNEHVWRGAQPGLSGLQGLAKSGAKTVLDLRPGEERGDREREQVEALGMHYLNVPMKSLHAPTPEQVQRALEALNDPAAWPVFVHCRQGEDRTGTVIACYRIEHDGWDNRKALTEAKEDGMHPWESGMKQFILHFDPHFDPSAANTR